MLLEKGGREERRGKGGKEREEVREGREGEERGLEKGRG